jgi:hypothetical protein
MNIITKSIKHGDVIFEIDDEYYEKISDWRVRCVENGSGQKYLELSKIVGPVRMVTFYHRYILDCPEDKVVDHIDGNTLNNRKSNLRVASQQQNCWNKSKLSTRKCHSKYLGVTWVKATSRWQARIGNMYLGRFQSEKEAGLAYDTYARKIYGEFARLNFPNDNREVYGIIQQKKTSKYKGVIFDKKTKKWRASVMINGKRYSAGKCFNSENEAAIAYNSMLLEHNGSIKRLIKIT